LIARVEKITIFPEKGKEGRVLQECRFIKNLGLEGDYHAVGGDRQISILFVEKRELLLEEKEKGLCFSRFKENISIRGLEKALPGTKLAAGETVLEITEEIKHCHDDCPLYDKNKPCSLAGLNLFAKVVKDGFIRVGDRIYG